MYYGYVTRYMLSCKRLFNDCCNVFRAFAPAHSMTIDVDGTWTTWTKKKPCSAWLLLLEKYYSID